MQAGTEGCGEPNGSSGSVLGRTAGLERGCRDDWVGFLERGWGITEPLSGGESVIFEPMVEFNNGSVILLGEKWAMEFQDLGSIPDQITESTTNLQTSSWSQQQHAFKRRLRGGCLRHRRTPETSVHNRHVGLGILCHCCRVPESQPDPPTHPGPHAQSHRSPTAWPGCPLGIATTLHAARVHDGQHGILYNSARFRG